MIVNHRRWPAAALAGGLALAAWVGCGGEPSVASRSAAAFQEAQKKGETFEDSGHSHGHGAITPGGENQEESAPGHDHGQAEAAPDHSAMDHSAMDHSAMGHGAEAHGAEHAPQHGGAAEQDEHAGHTGHDARAPQTPPAEGEAEAAPDHSTMDHSTMDHSTMDHGQSGHEGHGEMAPDTAVAAPKVVSPGQPAKTLSPDPLDAPAATSVQDAQRSAEMAEEMSGGGGHEGHGGHGGHGTTGTYRQTDAGRGPEAREGSEPRTPGHDSHQHGAEDNAAAAYVCPMHPEVTSDAPGKCSKCGMDLVKRRKG
ncbi:MAG TPA: heavy metal-binding domain-containing protein [Thermoanaerobaculia bacterium]